MNRTIFTRIGPLGTAVLERRGRWRASLLSGPPGLGRIDSAIDGTADGAFANLSAAVEAALTPVPEMDGLADAAALPSDG
jgi:hypothetical protein